LGRKYRMRGERHLLDNLNEKEHLENFGIGWRITLKWILIGRLAGSTTRIDPMAKFCE
jgi:hypothetical protein